MKKLFAFLILFLFSVTSADVVSGRVSQVFYWGLNIVVYLESTDNFQHVTLWDNYKNSEENKLKFKNFYAAMLLAYTNGDYVQFDNSNPAWWFRINKTGVFLPN